MAKELHDACPQWQPTRRSRREENHGAQALQLALVSRLAISYLSTITMYILL
ncbi:hypothetical protein FOCG_18201 [Fusarium oxysporum f. sp. radicis-lycopersici 26381]|nr:hypothetical protein FOCG_18201 [Fusarium oxysporum f. sp. radicis-lycopersici 26381]